MAHAVVVAIEIHLPGGGVVEVPLERLIPNALLLGEEGKASIVSIWDEGKVGRSFSQYIGFPVYVRKEVREIDMPGKPVLPKDLKV